jgi:ABC-type antimicrobial peptide transport system permease subunit
MPVVMFKDFNDRSFRQALAPLLITTNVTMYSQAGIKLETKNISSTLQSVKTIWEQTFPNFVYEYRFLDDRIAGFYKQQNQLEQLYKIFAAIAIFLSCLGLYGLASFMAVQRIKEVGIRKVLGASAVNIVYLFSKEFIMLIAIAFAIAASWMVLHANGCGILYRIIFSWWFFAAGGFVAIIIALATISFQAIKAANANPVNNLRSE